MHSLKGKKKQKKQTINQNKMLSRVLLVLCMLAAVNGIFYSISETNRQVSVLTELPASEFQPEVQTLVSGDVVIAWYDSGSQELKARIITNADPIVEGDVIVVAKTPVSIMKFGTDSKELVGMSHGGFIITWRENLLLKSREYSSTGVAMSNAIQVSSSPVTLHSIIPVGTGALMLFGGGSTFSFRLTSDIVDTPVTHFSTNSVSAIDMIEISSGFLVVFSEAGSALAFKVLDKTTYAIVSQGDFPASSFTWERIHLKSTFGRTPALISMGAHSVASDVSLYKTWPFNVVNVLDSTPTLQTTAGYEHINLAVGDSTTTDGQAVIFDRQGEFIYRSTDLTYTDIFGSDYNGDATDGLTVTGMSVAQLGNNGWIATHYTTVGIQSVIAISASYYQVPEIEAANDWVIGSVSGARLLSGNYAIAGVRLAAGIVRVFNNKHEAVRTINLPAATVVPQVAGPISADEFIVTYTTGAALQASTINTETGSIDTVTIGSEMGNNHVSKICRSNLIIVAADTNPDEFILTAHFGTTGVPAPLVLVTLSPGVVTYAVTCTSTSFMLVYKENSGSTLVRMEFSETTVMPAVNFPIASGSVEDAYTFSNDKTIIIYSSSTNVPVFIDAATNGQWNPSNFESTGNFASIAGSLIDDTLHVAYRVSRTPSSQDIYYTKYDINGVALVTNPTANRFQIGLQEAPTMIVTDVGPVVVYATPINVPSGGSVFIRPIVEEQITISPEVQVDSQKRIQTSPESCGMNDWVVVVWSARSGLHSSIYAKVYGPNGKTVAELRVNTEMASSHTNPSVACYTGGYYVTWEADGPGGTWVYAQEYTYPSTVGTLLTVSIAPTQGEAKPDIAVTQSGDRIVVAWHGDDETGNGIDVFMRIMSNIGPNRDPIIVNTVRPSTQKNPSVDISSDYNVIIVWQSYSTRYDVIAQRFDGNQLGIGGPINVNTVSDGTQAFPEVAFFSDKSFLIVWGSAGLLTMFDVNAARFDPNGVKVINDFRVNSNSNGNHRPSSLCVFQDGSYVVAWSYYLTRSEQDAYLRRFDKNSIPIGMDELINSHTNKRQFDPAVAVLNGFDLFVSWASKWQDGSKWSIYSSVHSKKAVAKSMDLAITTQPSMMVSRSLPDGGVVTLTLVCQTLCEMHVTITSNVGVIFTQRLASTIAASTIATFDFVMVGLTGYVLIHDTTSSQPLRLFSVGFANNEISNVLEISSVIEIETFPATLVVTGRLHPTMAISGDFAAIVYKNTNQLVGSALMMQLYSVSMDMAVGTPISLFPKMSGFTFGHSIVSISSTYYALANSMARNELGSPYLSVVETDGVVKKTVRLAGIGNVGWLTKVVSLPGNRVVVCYSPISDYVTMFPKPIMCELHQVLFLGTDVDIKRIGEPFDTALYTQAYNGETGPDYYSLAIVNTDNIVISAMSFATRAVFVKVFNSEFKVIESYTPIESNARALGISVCAYQVDGLVVTSFVQEPLDDRFQAMLWKQLPPVVATIDSKVPTKSVSSGLLIIPDIGGNFPGEGGELTDGGEGEGNLPRNFPGGGEIPE